MYKFNSLQLAIDLAMLKRDHAMTELMKHRQTCAFAQDQMDQLLQYATETEMRWTQGAQRSTTPELLHHHYQFMGRLQQAVDLQQGVLTGYMDKLEFAENALLQAEFRLAALKKLMVKKQDEATRQYMRRDQKQMDEFAAMQTLRHVRQTLESSDEY